MLKDVKIKEILGYAYKGVNTFFKTTINEFAREYDYVVLMARRCLLLYDIFNFEAKNLPTNIISDLNLDKIEKGKKILIVDDIIIHGRTVHNLYTNLVNKGKNVNILVYYKYVKSLPIEGLIGGLPVTRDEWHDLSDRLVSIVLKANVPYATFVPAFSISNDVSFNDRFFEAAINCRANMDCNFDAKVYFTRDLKKFPLLNQLCCAAGVRKYFYNNSENSIYIPTVFIKSLNAELFDKIIANDKICEVLGYDIIEIFGTGLSLNYKSILLTFILSFLYGKLVLSVLGINTTDFGDSYHSVTKRVLTRSFSDRIISEMDKIDIISINELFSLKIQDIYDIHAVEAHTLAKPHELLEKYPYAYEDKDINGIVFACLSALHIANEKDIENGDFKIGRRFGYSLSLLREFVRECVGEIFCKQEFDYKYYASVIALCDSGYATYKFREAEQNKSSKKMVVPFVDDGEQIYRLNHVCARKFQCVVRYLYDYIRFFTNMQFSDAVNDYIKFVEHKIKNNELTVTSSEFVDLKNVLYDVANTSLLECKNSNEEMSSSVSFFYNGATDFCRTIKNEQCIELKENMV